MGKDLDKFTEALVGLGITLSIAGFLSLKTKYLEELREKTKEVKNQMLLDKLISYKKDFDIFMEEMKSKENSDVSNKV